MKRALAKQEAPTPAPQDKWQLFEALKIARVDYGLNNRTLQVLQALLSFYPRKMLSQQGPMIVFPSNRTLSERANGMPESTLRRHIAALCNAGVIARHDSPNGKRYCRRNTKGEIARAFGFDLLPLLTNAPDIIKKSERILEERTLCAQTRECIKLQLRDLWHLNQHNSNSHFIETLLSDYKKILRRQLTLSRLNEIRGELSQKIKTLNNELQALIATEQSSTTDKQSVSVSSELSGKNSQNERHIKNIKTDKYQQFKELMKLAPDKPRDIYEFHTHAKMIASMTGINESLWTQATKSLGMLHAATLLETILLKIEDIAAPNAYFRTCMKQRS